VVYGVGALLTIIVAVREQPQEGGAVSRNYHRPQHPPSPNRATAGEEEEKTNLLGDDNALESSSSLEQLFLDGPQQLESAE
jgi:hypothetical protein